MLLQPEVWGRPPALPQRPLPSTEAPAGEKPSNTRLRYRRALEKKHIWFLSDCLHIGILGESAVEQTASRRMDLEPTHRPPTRTGQGCARVANVFVAHPPPRPPRSLCLSTTLGGFGAGRPFGTPPGV